MISARWTKYLLDVRRHNDSRGFVLRLVSVWSSISPIEHRGVVLNGRVELPATAFRLKGRHGAPNPKKSVDFLIQYDQPHMGV